MARATKRKEIESAILIGCEAEPPQFHLSHITFHISCLEESL